MTRPNNAENRNGKMAIWLSVLISLQTLCASYFLYDIFKDLNDHGDVVILWMEIMATLCLFVSVILEGVILANLLRRQLHLERGLSVAAGALSELIENYFVDWGLTSAEQDVATFAIKGYSSAEIAHFRGSTEGTVKSQLNAIYRKAQVPGRAQLVSIFVEDLFRGPIISKSNTRVEGSDTYFTSSPSR